MGLKPNVALPFIALALCTGFPVDAQDSKQISRLVNPAGWTFPGQEGIAGRQPNSATTSRIAGVPVEIARFSGLPIWNERQKQYLVSRVVFAYSSGESLTIRERELVAHEVSRYSVANRPFLYTMLAYPCAVDPETKHGGCAGADVKLAYYDEDGDGSFEVLEVVNPILSSDTSRNWHPRVPTWAAASARRD